MSENTTNLIVWCIAALVVVGTFVVPALIGCWITFRSTSRARDLLLMGAVAWPFLAMMLYTVLGVAFGSPGDKMGATIPSAAIIWGGPLWIGWAIGVLWGARWRKRRRRMRSEH